MEQSWQKWRKMVSVFWQRLTGIGYKKFPPLSIIIYPHELKSLKEAKTKAQIIRREAAEFENAVFHIMQRRGGSDD